MAEEMMTRELPVSERNVVRLVVLDVDSRLLLLHIRDLSNPQFGTAWELPGGGMEPDETYLDAAVRELREETGIAIAPGRVSHPTWRRDVAYTYRGVRRLQHEVVAAVRLQQAQPVVEISRGNGFESEDHFESRWWTLEEIVASSERFYPRHLPALLPRFLAGEQIEEPIELWL
jgi:8-oxo-dGTP pyrophosphatase MutT (NUDIX family)